MMCIRGFEKSQCAYFKHYQCCEETGMTVNTNGGPVDAYYEKRAMQDDKGRTLAEHMTDREIMEATLHNQRAMLDLVNDFVENMKTNPMMKMMTGKR